MPSSFVIAFGGTGARCVEAFIYLQAAGLLGRATQILLVDPDTSNGNTDCTRTQLLRYRSLQETVRGNGEEPEPFFFPPINPDDPSNSVSWDYPTPPQPFQSILAHAGQDEGTRGLLELLYDGNDFDLSFEQGFVGRAHIGSLDVLRTLSGNLEDARVSGDAVSASNALVRFFQRVRGAAQGEGARVVVVGSLFGGTGASALPAIPPLIKDTLADVADSIDLASVQMGPYFSFDAGGEHDPDSALHPLATQAALHHYAGSSDYDSIYFIGAPNRTMTSVGNQRGGTNQKNEAHYAELAAALATRDFFQRPSGHYGKAIAAGGETADWSGFPSGDPGRLRKALTAFSTAAYFHSVFLYEDLRKDRHRNHVWERVLARDSTPLGGGEEELELLKQFTDRYLQWASEVSGTTDRPLFDLASPWNAARLGRIGRDGDPDADAYDDLFEALNRSRPVNQTNPVGQYLDMLTRAAHQFCARHYASWWKEESRP